MNEKGEFIKYIETWMAGINEEAIFWDRLFASNGSCGGNSKVFKYRMDPMCPFQIQEDLEQLDDKILDVGSGPYSRIGFCVGEKKLDITLVDPLACVYRRIGKKYNITFPIQAQTGIVELLHFFLPAVKYDFVHMSNALDHCFDPIIGIKEMLFLTKIGGKIVLRHSDNEAEKEQYRGFHQWNLTINNKGKFIIWRKGEEKIIVNEIIRDYADVIIAKKTEEVIFDDTWEYNKVVIKKKKDIPINELLSPQVISCIVEMMIKQNAPCLFDKDITLI